jgi:citrate synthase
MGDRATLNYNDKKYDLPVVVGTENEHAVDIQNLRAQSGLITLDDGYGNTGSCLSSITFIDGEKGILRYRGYPIEELAEHSTFIETAYLLIFGELPSEKQLTEWRQLIQEHMFIHEAMRHHFEGFPPSAPPMAILSAMINTAGCFEPALVQPADSTRFQEVAARLIKIGRAHV